MVQVITAYGGTPHGLVDSEYTWVNVGDHSDRSEQPFSVLRCFQVDDELP